MTRWFPNNPYSRKYLLSKYATGTEPFEVDILSAACVVVRTGLAKELNGFDESFTFYWVDAEMCGRMKRRGYSIYCVPPAGIMHYEGQGGSTKTFRQRCKMTIAFNRDSYLVYIKYRQLKLWSPSRWLAAALLSSAPFVHIGAASAPGRATFSGGKN